MGLAALGLLLALAGCGDPPSPFEHQTPFSNPLLAPGLRGGVIVAPVASPDHELPGDVITDAVVLALRDAEVPALTETEARPAPRPGLPAAPPPPARHVLRGEIRQPAPNAPLRVDWRLIAPDGHEAAAFASEPQVGIADWQSVSPALRAAIAADVVRNVGRYLDDAEGLPPAIAALAKVTVVAVDGMAGAGPVAMARALEYHLAQAGLTVDDTVSDDSALVVGAIAVTPAASRGGVAQDNLRVSWTVLRPDGRELGVVDQANDVPRGALQGAWGDLAFLIAEAAAPGIVDLLQQAAQADAAASAAGPWPTPQSAP